MPKGKRHSAQFKFKVALEAAKGTKTLAELASEYGLHPSQTLALRASARVSEWKQQLLQDGPSVFGRQPARQQREQETLQAELYEQIGRLKNGAGMVEKKLPDDIQTKRAMIEPNHPELSMRRQCELIGLNRSTLYYQRAMESALNLQLMRLIDEQYTRTLFYGWPRMTAHLRRQRYVINHKRVQRLLRLMGLQA